MYIYTYSYHPPDANSGSATRCLCKLRPAYKAMSEPLRDSLKDAYPDDKAHGYQLGDLRGLIRVESSD